MDVSEYQSIDNPKSNLLGSNECRSMKVATPNKSSDSDLQGSDEWLTLPGSDKGTTVQKAIQPNESVANLPLSDHSKSMQVDLQKEQGVNMQRADKKLTLLECSNCLSMQAADAEDNGSGGNMPVPDKSKPPEAMTQNNEAGANKQRSDKQLMLPKSNECPSVQAVDAQDKRPEGNMPVLERSKLLQIATQNIEQEATMESSDNLVLTGSDKCKSLQAAAQHNGSETVLLPSEKSAKAVRKKKQSKKGQRSGKSKCLQTNNKSNTLTAAPKSSVLGDDNKDVWSKLGAMKCPNCGLVTSDTAVLNAHPCHRRRQQASKKRASPVSHSVSLLSSTDSSSFPLSKPDFPWKSRNLKAQYSGKRKLQSLRIAAPGGSVAETVMLLASTNNSEQHANIAAFAHYLSEQQASIAPFTPNSVPVTHSHLTEQQANVAPIARSDLTEQQANIASIAHSDLTEQQAYVAPIAHSDLAEQQANVAPIAHSDLTEQQADVFPIAFSDVTEQQANVAPIALSDVTEQQANVAPIALSDVTEQQANVAPIALSDVTEQQANVAPIAYSNLTEQQADSYYSKENDVQQSWAISYDSPSDKYTCHLCNYSQNGNLFLEHVLCHAVEIPYSCMHCSCKFKTRVDIRNHCNHEHSGLPARSSLNGVRIARNIMGKVQKSGKVIFPLKYSDIEKISLLPSKLPAGSTCSSSSDSIERCEDSLAADLPTSSITSESASHSLSAVSSVSSGTATDSQNALSIPLHVLVSEPMPDYTSNGSCNNQVDVIKKTVNPSLTSSPAAEDLNVLSRSAGQVKDLSISKDQHQQSQVCEHSQENGTSVNECFITGIDMQKNCDVSEKCDNNLRPEVEVPELHIFSCQGNYVEHFAAGQQTSMCQTSESTTDNQQSRKISAKDKCDTFQANSAKDSTDEIENDFDTVPPLTRASVCRQNNLRYILPRCKAVAREAASDSSVHIPLSIPNQHLPVLPSMRPATQSVRQLIIRKRSPQTTNIHLLTTEATRSFPSNQQHFSYANQSQHLPVNCTVNSNGGIMSTQPFALNSLQKNPSVAHPASWMFYLRRLLESKGIPQALRESRGFLVAPTSAHSPEYAAAGGSLPGSTLYAQHATFPIMRQQAMATSQNGTNTSNPSPFNLSHFAPSVVQSSTSLSSTSTTFSTTGFPVAGLHIPTVSGSASLSSSNSVLASISSASCNLAPYTTLPVIGPQTMTESSTAATPSLSTSVTSGVVEVSVIGPQTMTESSTAATPSLSTSVTSGVVEVSAVNTPTIASTDVSSAELTRTEAHVTNTFPSFSSLSFIKKEHLEPKDSVEACPSIAPNAVESRATIQTSPSTLDSGDSPAILALRSYMMWNDQFVCLPCRKRFKEKQEFYSHVWNHQHPDKEICQQCSFLNLDHVCQKTDETLKEIVSNINLIDACILNHVGNPQIRERILKISTPGSSTEPVSIPDTGTTVTESETPSTEIQKYNNLQNENDETSSVDETDSGELALKDTAVAETVNLGLCPQTMASSSVPACISLPVVDNIRSETTGTSGVNASDVGETEEINKMARECVRSKSTEDKTLTKDTVDHSKSKAEMINQKSRSYLCFVEAQSEIGSKSCEHESGTTISWSVQSNVIQAASTESAIDTVDHHSPTSAVVTESSTLSQKSSQGVPETELPPHDPTTSTVTENSPHVSKDLTSDVNPDSSITADVSSRAAKTVEATMDVSVFIDGDDVQFSVANTSSPKDIQEPGTLNDVGNSIDSVPFLSLIPNPSITMSTERRDSHLVTLTEPQRDLSLRTSPELVLDHLGEKSGALNATHALLSSLEINNVRDTECRPAGKADLANVQNTNSLYPGSMWKDRVKHTLHSSTEMLVMEREEDISLPCRSEDKLSDGETVASDTNHVPSSLKVTHSVQNPEMIAGNKMACENLLGGTITDRDKTEIETATEERQYSEGESSSEMQMQPIASEPEVPIDKTSGPETAVLELSRKAKPEKQNLGEGLDIICSGGQASCSVDMEDHQLCGTDNDICHEAQDESRKAARDQLLRPEQTAFPEQKGQHTSIEEASSTDSDRLSMFYACSLCTFSCCLATDFTMHLNSCHDDEVDFVCFHCQYRGAYTTDLTNHITEHTISSALFSCPAETCTFRAESIRQLEPHIKAHSELVECCCRTCKLSFASSTDLLNHFKEHSKTLFSCSRCPARFLSKAAIMHHCQQDHTGRCLFRVVGMLLCQQRMENGYKIFALDDMKLKTKTNEAMVKTSSKSQDTNLTSIDTDSSTLEVMSLSEPVCDHISRKILDTSCVRGDSMEYGSDQFKASKHISSQDSCGIKSPNPDESVGSKKANSLKLSTENVSLVKGLLKEAVLSVRQEVCDKMRSIKDVDSKLTKEDSVSFHSVVSMPLTIVNAFVAKVDTPNNKQAENRCTGETSHEALRQNQTKEEESQFNIPFIHSPTPIEPLLFSAAAPDATVTDPASSRQTMEIAASHAEYSENSAVSAEPLLTSGCLPVTAGTTIPGADIDKCTWSLSSTLRSNMPLPEERPSVSTPSSLPITEHPPKKQVPTARKRYALLDLCGTNDLDKAMNNVLYTQIGSNYRCHYCDRLIDSLEKVHCHLFYHNKVSLTACLHCKKTGSSRESVLRHTKQEHPNNEQTVNLLSVKTTFIKTLNSEPLTLKRFKKVCKILKNPNTDYLDQQSSCTESLTESADVAGRVSSKGRKLLSGQKVNRTALSEDQEATKNEVESRQLLSEGQEVMRIKAEFAQLSSENQETTKVKTEFSQHSIKLSVEPSHKGPTNFLESLSEAKQDDDNHEVSVSGSSCSDELPLVGEQALKKIILSSPLVNSTLSPLFEQASGVGGTSVYTCKVCSNGKVQFSSRYQIHRHLLEHLEVRSFHCCYCSFAAVEKHDVRLHIKKCHKDKPDRFKHVGVNLPDIVRNFIIKQKQNNNSTSSTRDYFDEKASCGKRNDKSQADVSLTKKVKKDYSSVKIKSWPKFRWNSSGHSSLIESKMKKCVLSSCTLQKTNHQETHCDASTSNETGLSQNAHASTSEPSSVIFCTPVSDNMHTEEEKAIEDEMKEVMYKCKLCSFQGHKIQTEEHIKTAHAYHTQLLKCGHCSMLYGNRVLLKNHTRSVHPNLPLKEEPLSWTMCYMELSPSKSSPVKYSQKTSSNRISHTSPKRKAKDTQSQPKNYVKKMRQDLDVDSDSEPVFRTHKSITKIKGKSLQAQIGSDDSSNDDFESVSESIHLQSPRSMQKSSPPTKCEGASLPSVQNKHHFLFKAHSATQDHCSLKSTVQSEKQTFYRCGHCQETFSSNKEIVNHGRARHPTQLLSLEVHRQPATEMKTSQLSQESKEKSLQPTQFGASKAPKLESCSDLFDTEASILQMTDGLSVQCTDGIKCHLCHRLFSCYSHFSDHAAEIHFANTDMAHWQDVQSRGVYNSRGVLVVLGSKPVVFKYLCAYCPTRGIHKHLMMQHQQEQHKDKSPWIIVLQSAASATEQTTKSCSRVEMKDTAASGPQRKKHKYEILEQELEVALTDVFTLDPLKFRNFLGANGVTALNMACLPRKTLFEVLKRGKRNQ